REGTGFYEEFIGQPLVVQARGGYGLLGVAAVVNYVEDGLQHAGNDGAAARRTRHEGQFAAFGEDGGRHAAEHALAGRDGVGGAAHEAVG
nr:hypothetical protein [Tanacetum cinerariifolium]